MNKFARSFKNKISKKILIGILLFSSFLTLISTAYKLYQDYLQDLTFIDSELESIQNYVSPVLSESLRGFDSNMINILMDSALSTPHVSYIEITDEDGRELYQGGLKNSAIQPDKIKALYFYDKASNNEQFLGHLKLYADHSQIYDALKNRIFVTLYTQFFKTFLTAFFILLLVHYVVSRHLITIVNFLRSHRHASLGLIKLDRPKSNDELQQVVDGLNLYRHEIKQQIATISNKNLRLEQEVLLRKLIEQNLALKNSLTEAIFNTIEIGILVIDREGIVVNVNRAVKDKMAETELTLVGERLNKQITIHPGHWHENSSTPLSQLLYEKDQLIFIGYCQYAGQLKFPTTIKVYHLYDKKSLDKEQLLGCAIFITDESDKETLEEINYNATHDYLTGTYNRFYFGQCLEDIITNNDFNHSHYTIGLLNLDSFKKINDLFGHIKGDEVLIQVTKILRSHFGQGELISRQGGDEFVFVIPIEIEAALQKTEAMLRALETTDFYHNNQVFHISASVGLAAIQSNTETVASAIARADQGCYCIKSYGGGNVEVTQQMSDSLQEQLLDYQMVENLKQSINAGSLSLYVQKIIPIDQDSNLPEYEEILVRLIENDQVIMPGSFIPVLERERKMHLLDKFVTAELTKLIARGRLDTHFMTINLSPFSMHDKETRQSLLAMLDVAKQHAVTIVFEITENALVTHFEKIKDVTRIIKQNGGKIAIDDFGTGYASYAYLDQLDIDFIKIDGSLVSRASKDSKILAIIASIQSIADSMGALTVAEHVKNNVDKALMSSIGIHYSQGYLDSKPSPLKD